MTHNEPIPEVAELYPAVPTDAITSIVYDPIRLTDSDVAGWLAHRTLHGQYCWARGIGWKRYDGRRWADTADEHVVEVAREALLGRHSTEARADVGAGRLRELSSLLSANRIRAIVSLARGILLTDASAFDQHPDLLNVGNGVVDLRTGNLLKHDPKLLLTRITEVDFEPGAQSKDWQTALEALPEEVATWMQVRFGQAITGHMTSDDVLPVLQGGGSNGKTTILAAIRRALGEHAVTVPERLLLANPGDHPTDLTTLRGARLAVIEETPEGGHISVKRLKDVLGSPEITARQIRQDNVTWRATHSLFLTTNYPPGISETDHGTWRRLLLVRFPYTYVAVGRALHGPHHRRGDPGLRDRLAAGREGQHRAVLAWLVAGASSWHAGERIMPAVPAVVAEDTAQWRGQSDMIYGFIRDELVLEGGGFVLSTDLYATFSAWLSAGGRMAWSEKTFNGRLQGHDAVAAIRVAKVRKRLPAPGLSRPSGAYLPDLTAQPWVWTGIRFRTAEDATAAEPNAAGAEPVPTVPGHPGETHKSRCSWDVESSWHSQHKAIGIDSRRSLISPSERVSTAPRFVA